MQAEAINQIANQSLPSDTWRNVHSWLSDLCDVLENQRPDSTIFIDCNPSFAAYTELSIVAANKTHYSVLCGWELSPCDRQHQPASLWTRHSRQI